MRVLLGTAFKCIQPQCIAVCHRLWQAAGGKAGHSTYASLKPQNTGIWSTRAKCSVWIWPSKKTLSACACQWKGKLVGKWGKERISVWSNSNQYRFSDLHDNLFPLPAASPIFTHLKTWNWHLIWYYMENCHLFKRYLETKQSKEIPRLPRECNVAADPYS